MIKDFNSFKTVNPNEIVLSIKQLENKGVVISKSSGKGFAPVNAFTKIAYDPTRKPIKKFSFGDESYELVNAENKGKSYNSWFGVLLFKSGKPVLLIHLYERKGVDLDLERGELLIRGVEEFVTVYLDNLDIKRKKL